MYEMLDRGSLILVFRCRSYSFPLGFRYDGRFLPSLCSVSLLFLAMLWFSIVLCAREWRKWRKNANLCRSVEEKWRIEGALVLACAAIAIVSPVDNRSPTGWVCFEGL
eukprot:TRINITY_DN40580_c2_g1_i1.p1 TRINITY_DN40580_c2_g1~~TRINITY_DN40580_c2_g1_i1.p1  ORF type:complete len:108 (+),score=12.23 TRINITY_DN40580_c2_g1_i1:67-390(+)